MVFHLVGWARPTKPLAEELGGPWPTRQKLMHRPFSAWATLRVVSTEGFCLRHVEVGRFGFIASPPPDHHPERSPGDPFVVAGPPVPASSPVAMARPRVEMSASTNWTAPRSWRRSNVGSAESIAKLRESGPWRSSTRWPDAPSGGAPTWRPAWWSATGGDVLSIRIDQPKPASPILARRRLGPAATPRALGGGRRRDRPDPAPDRPVGPRSRSARRHEGRGWGARSSSSANPFGLGHSVHPRTDRGT